VALKHRDISTLNLIYIPEATIQRVSEDRTIQVLTAFQKFDEFSVGSKSRYGDAYPDWSFVIFYSPTGQTIKENLAVYCHMLFYLFF
jgi:hypothetical protein